MTNTEQHVGDDHDHHAPDDDGRSPRASPVSGSIALYALGAWLVALLLVLLLILREKPTNEQAQAAVAILSVVMAAMTTVGAAAFGIQSSSTTARATAAVEKAHDAKSASDQAAQAAEARASKHATDSAQSRRLLATLRGAIPASAPLVRQAVTEQTSALEQPGAPAPAHAAPEASLSSLLGEVDAFLRSSPS